MAGLGFGSGRVEARRRCRWRGAATLAALLALAAGGPGEVAAAGVDLKVILVSPAAPPAGTVVGWGREGAQLRLEARLERPSAAAGPGRLFMTANVSQGGRTVDGVRLYDDGSHGDARVGDGQFGSDYRPPRLGAYTVQVRAQADLAKRPGLPGARELWSETNPFYVEQIPYPRIVFPEPGGRVGRSVVVRARLLLGDQPFTETDPTLEAAVLTRVKGAGAPPLSLEAPAERRGSLLTAPVVFAGLGAREIGMKVSVQRHGQRLSAVDGPIRVTVANPPVLFFWAAGGLLALALLLPRRRSIPVFTHSVQVRDSRTGQTLTTATIEGDPFREVRRTVGKSGADVAVTGAAGTLCSLVAEPGRKALRVEQGEAGPVRSQGATQATLVAEPQSPTGKFQIGEMAFNYQDARAVRSRDFAFWYPTPAKLLVLILAAGALGLAFWQRGQFYQQ